MDNSAGINIPNTILKADRFIRDIEEFKDYIRRLDGVVTKKTIEKNDAITAQETNLIKFLSDEVSKAVLEDEYKMVYWEKATGISMEDLANRKREAIYANLQAEKANLKKERAQRKANNTIKP